MPKFNALRNYLKSKYPEISFEVRSYASSQTSTDIFDVPSNYIDEVEAFFKAWDLGFENGWYNSAKNASDEYVKNINEIVLQTYAAGLNEGLEQGKKIGFQHGMEREWRDSIIPSDAYDIEVFSVQPSNDFETGLQALVGFKVPNKGEGNSFHFIQIQFSVTNPNKKQIS